MKIYVITESNYLDYHICAITDDKDKAELLKEKYSGEYSKAEIKIFDTETSDNILKYKYVYFCILNENKNNTIKLSLLRKEELSYVEESDYLVKEEKFIDGLGVYVCADNEEMALKKASDLFEKYKKEKLEVK